MSKFNTFKTLKIFFCFSMVAGFSASAIAEDGGNLSQNDANATEKHSRVVVFGRFELYKNGVETKLGDSFFSNTAALNLYRPADQEEMTVKVGDNGEFSRTLAPGEYYLIGIEFKHRGESVQPETNYVFTVPADAATSYMGTIAMHATFSGGYMGVDGKIDRFILTDDCRAECSSILSNLGLAGSSVSSSLPTWERQLAYYSK